MSQPSGVSSFTVLIVDDNPKVRTLIRDILRAAGCETCYAAGSADEAIALLNDIIVDVVLTDYHMTPKTGVDLTIAIRKSTPLGVAHLPIVMMTGDVKPATVAAARSAGVDGFVAKPFSVQLLLERLVAAMNRSRDPQAKVRAASNPLGLRG